ncbi:unnamed protein product [Hyaloperonospora brassicae]|uniref:Replication termination factor 2 n=1 Tax=Hyaloperonospora brassicae TaxID=162125 RepID=A0AAV0TG85_HYABA|nr:unnamed protein product [Hyaloperonospora brassicae]
MAAAAADVELLLVRIDRFQDRTKYVSVLRAWLRELEIAHGRLIRMGADLQLLFVAASASQNAQLRQWYRTRPIDTNCRGEQCVDRFVDVLGTKTVQRCSCRGFVEMEVLSPTLLQKVLVHEWQAEQEWLDTALATTRTKAFLAWKEAAKAARQQRRKKERQEKEDARARKRAKRAQERPDERDGHEEAEVGGEAAARDASVEVDEDSTRQTAVAAPKQEEVEQGEVQQPSKKAARPKNKKAKQQPKVAKQV